MDKIIIADTPDGLRQLPDQSVHTIVTSPPYWGLRDYGIEGQIGLEETPGEYVERLVEIFREARRVLRDDGTLWLNLGDSYNGSGGAGGDYAAGGLGEGQPRYPGRSVGALKPKDLVGIPWRVAFALQADGWWLRSDIIWAKPNPMPESVRDRPTKAHEYIFMLAKSQRYYYDQDAIREPHSGDWGNPRPNPGYYVPGSKGPKGTSGRGYKTLHIGHPKGRNKRTVWTVPTKPFKGAHFAVFPPDLIRPCILAGCPPGGIVLDPFFGSGTVGVVARQEGRHYIGIELNPGYAQLAKERIASECPMDRLPLDTAP